MRGDFLSTCFSSLLNIFSCIVYQYIKQHWSTNYSIETWSQCKNWEPRGSFIAWLQGTDSSYSLSSLLIVILPATPWTVEASHYAYLLLKHSIEVGLQRPQRPHATVWITLLALLSDSHSSKPDDFTLHAKSPAYCVIDLSSGSPVNCESFPVQIDGGHYNTPTVSNSSKLYSQIVIHLCSLKHQKLIKETSVSCQFINSDCHSSFFIATY